MKKYKEVMPNPTKDEDNRDQKHLEKINEKWNELRKIAKEDLQDPPVNDFSLPSINIKWLNFRSDWILALIDLELKKYKIEKSLIIEYRTTMDIQLTKDEEMLFIRSDSRYIKIYEKCKRISGLLQYIEGVLKALENKYYLIKEYNIRQRYLKGSID